MNGTGQVLNHDCRCVAGFFPNKIMLRPAGNAQHFPQLSHTAAVACGRRVQSNSMQGHIGVAGLL